MTSEVTSRELVRRTFSQAKLPRTAFIPWVCSYAARLEQISVPGMFTDPTQLAKVLQNAQQLYGYDAVVNLFDPTLEAEACGCSIGWRGEQELPYVSSHILAGVEGSIELDFSNIEKRGRLPVVLEATRRLKTVLGRTVAIAAVVTGPLTIATQLRGKDIIQELDENPDIAKRIISLAGQIALSVGRAYCELEPDLLVLADALLPKVPAKHLPLLLSVLRPIWNLTRFYNSLPIVLTKECEPSSLDILSHLEVDGIVVGGGVELAELRKAVGSSCILGKAIPSSILVGAKEELGEYARGGQGDIGRAFLSTEWNVPYDTPPENLHEVIRELAALGNRDK